MTSNKEPTPTGARVAGEDDIERVARAICRSEGHDPDADVSEWKPNIPEPAIPYVPAWQDYTAQARAALATAPDPAAIRREALLEAAKIAMSNNLSDARAEIARLTEENARLREAIGEMSRIPTYTMKERAERTDIAEARLAAATTVTEQLADELKQLLKYARWQFTEGGSYHPTLGSAIGQASAALTAFTASKIKQEEI